MVESISFSKPNTRPPLTMMVEQIAIIKAKGKAFLKTVFKKFPDTLLKLGSYVKKKVGIPTQHAEITVS